MSISCCQVYSDDIPLRTLHRGCHVILEVKRCLVVTVRLPAFFEDIIRAFCSAQTRVVRLVVHIGRGVPLVPLGGFTLSVGGPIRIVRQLHQCGAHLIRHTPKRPRPGRPSLCPCSLGAPKSIRRRRQRRQMWHAGSKPVRRLPECNGALASRTNPRSPLDGRALCEAMRVLLEGGEYLCWLCVSPCATQSDLRAPLIAERLQMLLRRWRREV